MVIVNFKVAQDNLYSGDQNNKFMPYIFQISLTYPHPIFNIEAYAEGQKRAFQILSFSSFVRRQMNKVYGRQKTIFQVKR